AEPGCVRPLFYANRRRHDHSRADRRRRRVIPGLIRPRVDDTAAQSSSRLLERERRRAERRRLLASGPPSPCIAVCRLDEATGFCAGCFRTIDEIRDWIIMLPDERQAVLQLLVMALFNVTLWHVCAAFGVSFLASGRAAILAFTMPLWASLLAVPMLGERLGWNILAGLAIGLAAVGVLVAPDWRAIAASPIGIVMMLVAAFSWAAGTVSYKKVRWSMPTAVLTAWQIVIGAVPVAI